MWLLTKQSIESKCIPKAYQKIRRGIVQPGGNPHIPLTVVGVSVNVGRDVEILGTSTAPDVDGVAADGVWVTAALGSFCAFSLFSHAMALH